MKTEYTTFLVREGMEGEAADWMRLLQARRADCVATLEREKMHYESIFRLVVDGRTYLSWFSVQGEFPGSLGESEHEIDKVHLNYWKRCIDDSVPPVTAEHVVSFLPEDVATAIAARERRQQR
jgi:hypothetical protein